LSVAVIAVRHRRCCCRCAVTASLVGFRHFSVWRTPLTVTANPVSTTCPILCFSVWTFPKNGYPRLPPQVVETVSHSPVKYPSYKRTT
jgi:hypothetical protein